VLYACQSTRFRIEPGGSVEQTPMLTRIVMADRHVAGDESDGHRHRWASMLLYASFGMATYYLERERAVPSGESDV